MLKYGPSFAKEDISTYPNLPDASELTAGRTFFTI
jgi:hypothetical protein